MRFASTWVLAPGIVLPLVLTALLYVRGARPRDGIRRFESTCFWAGWALLTLALISPLHSAGEILFSAHMVQHEIVMVVGAPLLVLGRPLVRFLWAVPIGWRRRLGLFVSAHFSWMVAPPIACLLHAAAIWIWHYPALFDATLTSSTLHAAQHLSFLSTALLFWWSVFRAPAGTALLSLVVTTLHTGILGSLLTFSGTPLYPVYASGAALWGTSALRDQQLAGLIMWIPGGLSYLLAGLWIGSRMLKPGLAAAFLVILAGCGQSQERWQTARLLTGGNPVRGGELIVSYGCSSCHTVPGIREATATVGPPLTLIARRNYLAGILPNSPDNMQRWIRRPQEVHPGTAMPDLNVTAADARDITGYLFTLR